MANETLKSIKDCHSIFSNGTSVILGGKKCWLFRSDESFVAKLSSIRNPTRVAFLPNNTALIDGDGDGAYHYISLCDGKELWHSVKKGRRTRHSKRFAVSHDGTIVYDVYYRNSNMLFVDIIIPQEQIHRSYAVNDGLRVSHDIYCNENGNLCILQSQIKVDGDNSSLCGNPAIEQNGILSISFNGDNIITNWEKLWQSYPGPFTTARGCNGYAVLRSDFSVINIDTMDTYSLLEENELQKLPKDNFLWGYDPTRKLLTVCYLCEQTNAIIDCQSHKVVGIYNRDEWDIGYQGCLIGTAFWMGTCKGIIKQPFPHIETDF